jgi:putative DNA primase/helicase
VDDGLDFSPLTDSERKATREQAHAQALETAGPTLPPGDAEAAEAAATRLFRRPADALYPYRDSEGAILFWVCRWNNQINGEASKKILPLCWFASGGWRFAHWPEERPLYRLDEIQSNSDAPVILTEGEGKSDAAARIFPGWIATTSCGGAKSAKKRDWSALAGCQVMIWPDNDKSGAEYEKEVGKILTVLGCQVSVIDVAGLVEIDGGGIR